MSDFSEQLRRIQERLVDESDVPGPDSYEGQRILRNVHGADDRRRRRLRILVPVIALSVVAAAAVVYQPLANPQVVVCFEAPDIDSNRYVPSPGAGVGIEACSVGWERAELRSDDVPIGEVPPLVGCVGAEGSLWVFPSSDRSTCQHLNLSNPEPDQDIEPLLDLEQRLSDYLPPDSCVTISEAVLGIEAILADMGLTDWSIEVGESNTSRPCASWGIDGVERRVHIIPFPRAG